MSALGWLNPAYFAGLALLAIPVLIHLFRREREAGSGFPSLMFVSRIPIREKHRMQLRHIFLLLVRCALLLALILAFARPFLDPSFSGVAAESASRSTVVLIDRSLSMRRGDQWSDAMEVAAEIIDRKNARDRIALLAFDDRSQLLADWSTDSAALHTAFWSGIGRTG